MNERAWVVLVVRGMGIYFLLSWLPSLLTTLVTIATLLQTSGPGAGRFGAGPYEPMTQQGLDLLAELLAIGLALYLLLGGDWVISRVCRQIVGVCPVCGERAGGGAACPECGHGMGGRPGGRSGVDAETSGDEANADEPA